LTHLQILLNLVTRHLLRSLKFVLAVGEEVLEPLVQGEEDEVEEEEEAEADTLN
jgi:hypothetical protein